VTSPYLEQFKTLRDPAPSQFAALETARGQAVLRWIIGTVLVFGLLGCVTKGANSPADPSLASPGSSTPSGRTPLPGFGETQVSVQTPDQLLTWCLLLAATPEQRRQGLMGVTDPTLNGYDGMLFRYDSDVDEQYWMRDTPLPLSIAWVSADGHLVATADMAPCLDLGDQCQNYPESGRPPPYRFAIEVPQGQLPFRGITEGAVITDGNQSCS
jgi:uncharacterized membrane protein (UPF0127 family)